MSDEPAVRPVGAATGTYTNAQGVVLIPQPHGGALRPPIRKGDPQRNPRPGEKQAWRHVIRSLGRQLQDNETAEALAAALVGLATGKLKGTRLQFDALLAIYDRAGIEPPSRLRELAQGQAQSQSLHVHLDT